MAVTVRPLMDDEARLYLEIHERAIRIERIARDSGVACLTLHASLNAERFYAGLGYSVVERTEVALPNDHRLAAVVMGKDL